MVDWRALEPLTAEGLLQMAALAVRDTRTLVDRNARISHVGFRSHDQLEWESLLDAVKETGEVCMTFKPDGRKIPFIKLHKPLVVGTETLNYLEFPAPKNGAEAAPPIVVAYYIVGENREPQVYEGVEVREMSARAEDFIARDSIGN